MEEASPSRATLTLRRAGRRIVTAVAVIVLPLLTLWGAFALWYQIAGGQVPGGSGQTLKVIAVVVWVAFGLATLIAVSKGRAVVGLGCFAVGFAGLLLWWQQILPSNQRVWADDVARTASGRVDGNLVTLSNVRNFEWRSNTDYTQRWETRSYDLNRLDSVDMVLSYWSMRAIAHVLVSFGFDDGSHVVFSVEIRREKQESFSEIGGFFKEFELSVIAADERDVIRVRTNVRGEDDYLYRIRMPVQTMRSLFLAYVEQANRLVNEPRFYNTVTVNCTTLVYHMLRHIVGHLPIDYRLLFSGYLPSYVYKVGGLDDRYTLEQLEAFGRITDRAKAADRSATYSTDIRRGIPVLPVQGTAGRTDEVR
jgi:Domain of unknown function (DUF4105)